MSKSHSKRFVQSAWTLLTFQLVASVGAVGVTGLAAFHVQELAARLESTAPAPEAAVEEAVIEPERSLDPEEAADQAGTAPEIPRDPAALDETAIVNPATPPPDRAVRCDGRRNVFRVPANVEWCDTAYQVQRGQRLLLTVRGTWGHNSSPGIEPGGGDVSEPRAVYRRAAQGTLIGRIGDTVFRVGEGGEIQMPASGTLQFSINDIPGQFGDNSGYVDVFVQPAQGEQRAPAN
ncbi:MAG: LecA/PA-IL family lectin [Hyphomonadaceae bacterium]|nr:LecA/PA-IL family lectin [Hyphomonadaceae bacterium]